MRGKAIAESNYHGKPRITPAYAGKSGGQRFLSWHRGDHPCVCGEKADLKLFTIFTSGSPLRMRGKDANKGRWFISYRITPAYAGKSVKGKSTNGEF